MPPRASVVNLAPSWKRKGRNGSLDVTNFIRKRAMGHRRAGWKSSQLFDPRRNRATKSNARQGMVPQRDRGDDVFMEIQRYEDNQNIKTMKVGMGPQNGELFKLSVTKNTPQPRVQTAVVPLNQPQLPVEISDDAHEQREAESKTLLRLPISRGRMFGRFVS